MKSCPGPFWCRERGGWSGARPSSEEALLRCHVLVPRGDACDVPSRKILQRQQTYDWCAVKTTAKTRTSSPQMVTILHSHGHTHARTHKRAHTYAHTHTHAHTHTRTHAHAHIFTSCCLISSRFLAACLYNLNNFLASNAVNLDTNDQRFLTNKQTNKQRRQAK